MERFQDEVAAGEGKHYVQMTRTKEPLSSKKER